MANNNTFEFIGYLTTVKETEKFKPYANTTSAKGYTTTIFQPTIVAGCNRHFTRMKSLYKADGTGKVFTVDKGGIDKTTEEKIKGKGVQFAWGDRNKPEIIEQVAEFKKFVIDLEEPGRRYKLEKASEKVKDGSITENDLKELELVEFADVEKALTDSHKKRKEFIHEHDFIELVKKLIDSEKFSDRMFKIMGDIQWTEYQGKFRKNLVPSRIYLAAKDAIATSSANIIIFFKEDAVVEAKGGFLVNGFIKNYDNDRKQEISVPIEVWLDTTNDDIDIKKEKLHKLLVSQFSVIDESYKEIGVKVQMLNGSQKVEITEEMLNDFQKEMIELGVMTLDDVRAELGGDLYGDKVEKMVVETVSKGYTKGRKDTIFKDADFVIKAIELKETPKIDDTEDSSEDIFAGLM